MSTHLNPYIEQLSWAEARELILPVNPEFVGHADQLDLPKECCIFKVKYRYGDYLLKDGEFMLRNNEGENVPINHPDIPEIIKKNLSYAPTVPMGIPINKRVEIFLGISERIVPVGITSPGKIFGLTAVLSPHSSFDEGTIWNLTAGIRNIFSIPKISMEANHKFLVREFGQIGQAPKNYFDQWKTFRKIAHSAGVRDVWTVDVLYFSSEWFKTRKSLEWLNFQLYLREYAWENTSFHRNIYLRDSICSLIENECNLKTDLYILSLMRHISSIGASYVPGLSFSLTELDYPHALLYQAYKEIYGLEYAPLFIGTQMFNDKDSLYYSLEIPHVFDFNLRARKQKSKFDELRHLAYAVNTTVKKIKGSCLAIKNKNFSVRKGAEKAVYGFYHTEADTNNGIKPVKVLLTSDHTLKERINSGESNFGLNSAICRGIVGIHPVNN